MNACEQRNRANAGALEETCPRNGNKLEIEKKNTLRKPHQYAVKVEHTINPHPLSKTTTPHTAPYPSQAHRHTREGRQNIQQQQADKSLNTLTSTRPCTANTTSSVSTPACHCKAINASRVRTIKVGAPPGSTDSAKRLPKAIIKPKKDQNVVVLLKESPMYGRSESSRMG